MPWLLLAYAAFSLRAYLGPGLPIFWDAHSHLARSWFVSEALRAGEFPGWSNAWYGGYPALEFYSPFYYWCSGALAALSGDVIETTKVLLYVGQLAAVMGFQLFLRRLGLTVPIATVGALLLLKSSLLRWIIGTVGNYPTLMLVLILPFLLAYFLRSADALRQGKEGAAPRFLAGNALFLAGMGASHLTNTTAQLPALLAFELVWLWVSRYSFADWKRAVTLLAYGLALAGVLQVFIVVPMLRDVRGVSLWLLASDPPLRSLSLDPLLTLLGLGHYDFSYVFVMGSGATLFFCAVGMSLFSLSERGRRYRAIAAGFAVAVICIPLLGDRSATSAFVFQLALCAGAIQVLATLASRWLPRGEHVVIAATLVAAIVWPGAVADQPVPRYVRDKAFRLYSLIPETPTRSRTFDLTPNSVSVDGYYGWSSFSPAISKRAIPFGGFPQASSLDTNVLMALSSVWVREFRAHKGLQKWSDVALDIFFMADVQFLIDRPNRKLQRLPHASPAIFSERLEPVPAPAARPGGTATTLLARLQQAWAGDEEGRTLFRDSSLRPAKRAWDADDWKLFTPIVEAMGIDRKHATADKLFTEHEPIPAPTAPVIGGGLNATWFAVLQHEESLQHARIVAKASKPGYVRISYSYAPRLRVTLDGNPATIVPDALGGAFIMPFPAGSHSVEIRPPSANLRIGLAATCLLLGAALFVLVLLRREKASLGT